MHLLRLTHMLSVLLEREQVKFKPSFWISPDMKEWYSGTEKPSRR